MSYIAKAVYNLPLNWSNVVMRYMTSFPSDALHTTRMFFGSRTGVAQALYFHLYNLHPTTTTTTTKRKTGRQIEKPTENMMQRGCSGSRGSSRLRRGFRCSQGSRSQLGGGSSSPILAWAGAF